MKNIKLQNSCLLFFTAYIIPKDLPGQPGYGTMHVSLLWKETSQDITGLR